MPANHATLSCALIQADTRWADPVANRANLAGLMDRAPDCQLYVLPETCTTGFLGDRDSGQMLDYEGDLHWMRAQARQRSAAIACSLVAVEGTRIFNRFVLMRADGSFTTYDKHHLFGYGGEGHRYTAGVSRTRARLGSIHVDLQICYDVRFPVWCRNDSGFELQIFVANWPRPRVEHWKTLLRARAIENQAFVIGVNRTGVDGNNIEHSGASCAWDALGAALIEPLDEHEQAAVCALDFDALADVRKKFPFLADRDEFYLTA